MDYRKNYYELLEVPVSASKQEIRAAYRRLAKLYHPDKNVGNPESEEKFKLVNEANEILSNDILKHEYDAYREEQKKWEKAQAQKETGKEIKQKNKKRFTRTTTVTTETRIYIKGEIKVKYWAENDQHTTANFDRELDYKINPTEAAITISEQDIFPLQQIPLEYLRAFKESDIFSMPIPQPIRCEITGENGKEYFELSLNEIRIKNIVLDGITKHDNNSYGTLTGQVYAYSPKFTYEEVKETVEECFGETGAVERKEENGINYIRKEYYHPDCSRYWGGWVQLPKARGSSNIYTSRQPASTFTESPSQAGCGIFVWIIALLCILVLSPKFFVFALIFAGLRMLFYHANSIFSAIGSLISFIGFGLLFLFLIAAVWSISKPGGNYIKKKANTASVKTTRVIRQSTPGVDSAAVSPDTLITHFLKWKNYSGERYEGSISISIAALRNANANHRQMSRGSYQNMGEVYKTMLDYDSSQMFYLYETFDSIKLANNLDEVVFSQLLVSAIQSLPYFLVLDKDCSENYTDDFTRNYLANCKTDCCVGNEIFGVRSPTEFLSDLKGDCDTRSLLLYQIFKHYNYNVALLTSNYYKHAMIAVSFTNDVNTKGLNITIDDKRYYLWETTSADLNYGEVSSSYNNLTYWDISLLNKKSQ